jgi:hypothetical protein
VDAVGRLTVLMLQMHIPTRELDQRFVKKITLAPRPQPDVLEHIMRLVILLRIEQPEILEVARMVSPARR